MTVNTVAVDFDGVTAELPRLEDADEQKLLESDRIPGDYDDLRDFFLNVPDDFNPKEVLTPEWRKIVARVLLRPEPVPGVRDALEDLRSAGYRVIIVTNRPPALESLTRQWLDENDVNYDELRCVGSGCRKGELPDVDVVVDDSPHNVLSAAEHARRGVLFAREWSNVEAVADVSDVVVARQWSEVPRMLVLRSISRSSTDNRARTPAPAGD